MEKILERNPGAWHSMKLTFQTRVPPAFKQFRHRDIDLQLFQVKVQEGLLYLFPKQRCLQPHMQMAQEWKCRGCKNTRRSHQ